MGLKLKTKMNVTVNLQANTARNEIEKCHPWLFLVNLITVFSQVVC